MHEISKHEDYRDKLEDLCRGSNLTYSLQRNHYPFALTIKPIGGMDAQLSMLEDDTADYISPDASIVLAYIDGDLSTRITGTFTIGDSLLQKIKNLFKNLYATWTQAFFRDTVTLGYPAFGAAGRQGGSDKATPEAADDADFDEFFEADDPEADE